MTVSIWYVPTTGGDFHIVADGKDRCVLTASDPTPDEMARLEKFLEIAKERGWLRWCRRRTVSLTGQSHVDIKAPLVSAGVLLAEIAGRQGDPGVLTAIKSIKGELTFVTGTAEAADAAKHPAADAAVTVRRATPCCPDTFVAAERRASRVLQEFLPSPQWDNWRHLGFFLCTGGLSGHLYRIAHRHSHYGAQQGRICFDLTDGGTLHFHDTLLPGAEEALAAGLILQSQHEDWLRNEATCLGAFSDVYENPLGPGISDGVWDAGFTEAIGRTALWLSGGVRLPFIIEG